MKIKLSLAIHSEISLGLRRLDCSVSGAKIDMQMPLLFSLHLAIELNHYRYHFLFIGKCRIPFWNFKRTLFEAFIGCDMFEKAGFL